MSNNFPKTVLLCFDSCEIVAAVSKKAALRFRRTVCRAGRRKKKMIKMILLLKMISRAQLDPNDDLGSYRDWPAPENELGQPRSFEGGCGAPPLVTIFIFTECRFA